MFSKQPRLFKLWKTFSPSTRPISFVPALRMMLTASCFVARCRSRCLIVTLGLHNELQIIAVVANLFLIGLIEPHVLVSATPSFGGAPSGFFWGGGEEIASLVVSRTF